MKSLLCLFLLVSAVAPAAKAAETIETSATVNVLVTDRRGKPVRSARVLVNGSEHSGVTNNSGRVVFTNVKTGEYVLRVERDSFITFEKDFAVNGQKGPFAVVAAISPAASRAARPAKASASRRATLP